MFEEMTKLQSIQTAIFNELGPESGVRIHLYGDRAWGAPDRFDPVLLAIESPMEIDAELLGYLQMIANETSGPLSVHLIDYESLDPELQWQIRQDGVELFPKGQRMYQL